MAQLRNTSISGSINILSGSQSSSLAISFGSGQNLGMYFSGSAINFVVGGNLKTTIDSSTIAHRFGSTINPMQDLNNAIYLDRQNIQSTNSSSFVIDAKGIGNLQNFNLISTENLISNKYITNEITILESLNIETFTQSVSQIEVVPDAHVKPRYSFYTFFVEPTNVHYFRVRRWIISGSRAPNYPSGSLDHIALIEKRNTVNSADVYFNRGMFLIWFYKGASRYIAGNVSATQLQNELSQIPTIGSGNVIVEVITGSYYAPSYYSTNDVSFGSNSSLANGTILRITLTGSAIVPAPEYLGVIGYDFSLQSGKYYVCGISFDRILFNRGKYRFRHLADTASLYLSQSKLNWNSTGEEIQDWLNNYFSSMSFSGNPFRFFGNFSSLESALGDGGRNLNYIPNVSTQSRGSFCAYYPYNFRVLSGSVRNLLQSHSGSTGGLQLIIEPGDEFAIDETGPLIELPTALNPTISRVVYLETWSRSTFPIPLPRQHNLDCWLNFDLVFNTSPDGPYNSLFHHLSKSDGSIETLMVDRHTGYCVSFDYENKKFKRLPDLIRFPRLSYNGPECRTYAVQWPDTLVFLHSNKVHHSSSLIMRDYIGHVWQNSYHYAYNIYDINENSIEFRDSYYLNETPPVIPPAGKTILSYGPNYFGFGSFNCRSAHNTDRFIPNELSTFLYYDPNDHSTTESERFNGFNVIDNMNSFHTIINGKDYLAYLGNRFSRHPGYACYRPSGPNSPTQTEQRSLTFYLRRISFDSSSPISTYDGVTLPSWTKAVDQLAYHMFLIKSQPGYQNYTVAVPRKNHSLNQMIDDFRNFNFSFTHSSGIINTRPLYQMGMGCAWLEYDREKEQSISTPSAVINFIYYGANYFPGDKFPQVITPYNTHFVANENILFKFDWFHPDRIMHYAADFPHGDNRVMFCYSPDKNKNFIYAYRNNTTSPINLLGKFLVPANKIAILIYDCFMEKSILLHSDKFNSSDFPFLGIVGYDRNNYFFFDRRGIRSSFNYMIGTNYALPKLDGGKNEAVNFAMPTKDSSLTTKKYVDQISQSLFQNINAVSSSNAVLNSQFSNLQTNFENLQTKFEFISNNIMSWDYTASYSSTDLLLTMSFKHGHYEIQKIYDYDIDNNVTQIDIQGTSPFGFLHLRKQFSYHGKTVYVTYLDLSP